MHNESDKGDRSWSKHYFIVQYLYNTNMTIISHCTRYIHRTFCRVFFVACRELCNSWSIIMCVRSLFAVCMLGKAIKLQKQAVRRQSSAWRKYMSFIIKYWTAMTKCDWTTVRSVKQRFLYELVSHKVFNCVERDEHWITKQLFTGRSRLRWHLYRRSATQLLKALDENTRMRSVHDGVDATIAERKHQQRITHVSIHVGKHSRTDLLQ